MRARVTLGVGLPYQTDRVTLAAGLSFCLHKPCKRVRYRVTLAIGSFFIRPAVTARQTRMASPRI